MNNNEKSVDAMQYYVKNFCFENDAWLMTIKTFLIVEKAGLSYSKRLI
jgi:hypothetical protein